MVSIILSLGLGGGEREVDHYSIIRGVPIRDTLVPLGLGGGERGVQLICVHMYYVMITLDIN